MGKLKKPGGGKKETSTTLSSIASRGLRGEKLSPKEVKQLAGSVLGQDETKGPRKD